MHHKFGIICMKYLGIWGYSLPQTQNTGHIKTF
jgi:hypothetical protein